MVNIGHRQTPTNSKSDISLQRKLTFPLLLFYSTGTILGLGIYVLFGKIAGAAGMLAPFAFILAALIALLSGLSYSELSARIPKSGGVVNYVDEAFHIDRLSKTMGRLLVSSAVISTATVLNGYVGYVHVFAEIPPWIIITTITTVLSLIAIRGITQSAATITVITLTELVGIVLVIVLAGDNLASFPARIDEFIPTFDPEARKGIMLAAFLAFFTFIGFEGVVNVAEESKHPERDMPRAIIWSLVILTVLYVIISIIGVLGLTPAQLTASEAPLADILAQKNSNYPLIISAIGLIAIINGVLVQIVLIARVLYGMAERKLAPRIFGRLHPHTHTPIRSTIFSGVIVLVLALLFDLQSLAMATNYILLSVFVFVNLSLIVIKRQEPHPKGIRTYPAIIPWLGLLTTIGILLFQVVMVLG